MSRLPSMPHTPVFPIPVVSDVPRFSVVEAVTPVGTAPCADCGSRIVDTYFETDEGVICSPCQTRVTGEDAAARKGQFGRTVAIGIAAAAASAGTYFAVLAATGREMTVLLLLVGFAIGKAVRVGARGHGGRRLQWLAVALTYTAIAATYVPFVMKGYSAHSMATAEVLMIPNVDARYIGAGPTPVEPAGAAPSLGSTAVGFGGLLLLAFAAPLLEGANNLLGAMFTLGALAVAWRVNRSTARVITGPYPVRPSASV